MNQFGIHGMHKMEYEKESELWESSRISWFEGTWWYSPEPGLKKNLDFNFLKFRFLKTKLNRFLWKFPSKPSWISQLGVWWCRENHKNLLGQTVSKQWPAPEPACPAAKFGNIPWGISDFCSENTQFIGRKKKKKREKKMLERHLRKGSFGVRGAGQFLVQKNPFFLLIAEVAAGFSTPLAGHRCFFGN